MGNKVEMVNRKFGRLTVLNEVGKTRSGHVSYSCICKCGKEAIVGGDHLRRGYSQSCGCLRREMAAITGRRTCLVHGDSGIGRRCTPYGVWVSMKGRCYNENTTGYQYWGGRGITVCDRWLSSYERFKADLLALGWWPGLHIHRIDRDKGYNPSNVKVLSASEHGET